jgi:hypothetical protein
LKIELDGLRWKYSVFEAEKLQAKLDIRDLQG